MCRFSKNMDSFGDLIDFLQPFQNDNNHSYDEKWISASDFNTFFDFKEFYPLRIVKLNNGDKAYVGIKIKRVKYAVDSNGTINENTILVETAENIMSDSFKREFVFDGKVLLFDYDHDDDDDIWEDDSLRYSHLGCYYLSKEPYKTKNSKQWILEFSKDKKQTIWHGKNTKKIYDALEENARNYDDKYFPIAEKLEKYFLNEINEHELPIIDNISEFKNSDAYYFKINESLFHKMLNLEDEPTGCKTILLRFKERRKVKSSEFDELIFDAKTPEMVKTDSSFFENKKYYDLIYKPYFYQVCFSSRPSDIPHTIKDKMENHPEYWYEIPITFTNKNKQSDNNCFLIISSAASSYKSKDIIADWTKMDNPRKIHTYTAVKQKQLIKNESINDYCKSHNDNWAVNMKSALDNIFIQKGSANKKSRIDLKIYRIGQGNFIYGQGNNIKFAFDFGIPSDKDIKKQGDSNYDFISYCGYHPKVVIISHWHEDHIKGLFLLGNSFWNDKDVMFLAPDYETQEKSGIADTLVKYLRTTKQLVEISNCGGEIYKVGSDCLIFQGKEHKNKKKKEKPNPKSLLMQLKHTLLPADSVAEYWPQSYGNGNKYDTIVLPHHGGKDSVAKGHINKSFFVGSSKIKVFLCCGFNNQWEHPLIQTFTDLYNAYGGNKDMFEIECTNIQNPQDDIPKRVKQITKSYISINDA